MAVNMKSLDEAIAALHDGTMRYRDATDERWIELNWNASYVEGYKEGLGNYTWNLLRFIEDGSRARALNGWFWYPYMMGYRDGRGDRKDGRKKLWGD
jgi:hypothetical protein